MKSKIMSVIIGIGKFLFLIFGRIAKLFLLFHTLFVKFLKTNSISETFSGLFAFFLDPLWDDRKTAKGIGIFYLEEEDAKEEFSMDKYKGMADIKSFGGIDVIEFIQVTRSYFRFKLSFIEHIGFLILGVLEAASKV